MCEIGAQHLHPIRQKKAALELPSGDAAMQIVPRLVFPLPAADHELVILDRNFDLVLREASNSKHDAQFLRLTAVRRNSLDIVGRIPVCPRS